MDWTGLLIFQLFSGKKIPLRILRDLCDSVVNHFPKHRTYQKHLIPATR